MKEEKIFITTNDLEAHAVMFRVQRAFARVPQVEETLKHYGITPTPEVLKDALRIKRVERAKPTDEQRERIALVGAIIPEKFIPFDSYENCPALDEAIQKKLRKIDNKRERQAESADLSVMKIELFNLFHINGRFEIDTTDLLKYMEVKDGHIALPDDLQERIKADTSVYATTPEGIAARKKHEELARLFTEFVAMLPALPRPLQPDDYGNFFQAVSPFDYNKEGYAPTPLDYDKLVINQ